MLPRNVGRLLSGAIIPSRSTRISVVGHFPSCAGSVSILPDTTREVARYLSLETDMSRLSVCNKWLAVAVPRLRRVFFSWRRDTSRVSEVFGRSTKVGHGNFLAAAFVMRICAEKSV